MGVALACLVYLLTFFRTLNNGNDSLAVVKEYIFQWKHNKPLVWEIVGSFDYALFAWSIQFIDIAVAAVLFEIYPVGIIFLASWVYRYERRYWRITITAVALIMLSMVGLIFANASQITELDGFRSLFPLISVIGIYLVVAAVIAVAFSVFGLKWGTDLTGSLKCGGSNVGLELYCAVIALFLAGLVSVFINLGIGLAAGEAIGLEAMVLAVMGGIFANAVANIAWRNASLTTDNLGINAIGFAIPLLSLLWLFWIAQVSVARFDLLLIGTVAIITANLLLNFEAEIKVRVNGLFSFV